MSNLIFQQQSSSPSDAGSGYSQIYAKNDGKVYRQAGTDTEVEVSGITVNDVTTSTALSGSSVCAKAWVNFNGTSTVAIRSSFNVSSVTDNAQGSYTVNFSTAMANANYCATITSGDKGSTWGIPLFDGTSTYLAGSCRLWVQDTSDSGVDNVLVCATFFG